MRPRHAVLPTPSLSLRPVLSRSRTPITRQTPLIPSFVFKNLRTLSFSVSRKSCSCRSYENCRGVYQQFPFWNSMLANQETISYSLSPNSRICHTSENSPVSPIIATDPKTHLSKSCICHTSDIPPGGIGLSDARTSTPASVPTIPPTINYPLYFHILAHSFALFCTYQNLNPFVFNRFRTLCQKPPGWGEGHIGGMVPPFAKEDHREPKRSLQRKPAGPLLSRQIAGQLSGPAPKNRRRTLCLDVLALLLRSIPGFCI